MLTMIIGISGVVFLASIAAGWNWLILLTAMILVATIVGSIAKDSLAVVGENKVAVIYHREKQGFSRLLPTGRHWLVPYAEYVKATISTSAQAINHTNQAFTNGGIDLAVNWAVAYKMKPLSLSEDKQASLAKKLAQKGKAITQSQVGHIVQEVMSAYTMDELFAPGGRTRFERDVQRNAKAKLGGFGIEVQSVMVMALEMPAHVKASLEEAHERAVQTESEVKSLSRLHQVISQFTDKDMERLAELERLRMLGKNGVSMMMPMGYSLNRTPHPQTSPRVSPPLPSAPVSLLTPEAIQANFAGN